MSQSENTGRSADVGGRVAIIYFGLFFVFFILIGASYGAIIYFGSGPNWDALGWSETGDALSAIVGLPVAIGGTWLAIVLAMKALYMSEQQTEITKRQTELTEQQTEFSRNLESIENRERALRISTATLDHFKEVTAALNLVAQKAQTLDFHLIDALKKGPIIDHYNEINLIASRNDAASALGELAYALVRADRNKIFYESWRKASDLRPVQDSDLLRYYRRIQDSATDFQDRIDAENEELAYFQLKKFMQPSESRDTVKSRLSVDEGLRDIKDQGMRVSMSIFGLALYPSAIAQTLGDCAEALYEADVNELIARRRLSVYASFLRQYASYTEKKIGRDELIEAGEPGQFDFLVNQPEEVAQQITILQERNSRSRVYATGELLSNQRRHIHGMWTALDNLAIPRVVISPFLTGCLRRIHAAIFSFMAGVIPPMPMFGRSLL